MYNYIQQRKLLSLGFETMRCGELQYNNFMINEHLGQWPQYVP